jgi:hypothetical protein
MQAKGSRLFIYLARSQPVASAPIAEETTPDALNYTSTWVENQLMCLENHCFILCVVDFSKKDSADN